MRIGLFGGTFDPIHNAHLAIAVTARRAFALDRLLLIPAAHPPHKPDRLATSYTDRLHMVELACQGHRGLEASRLEEGQGKSYSIDTIERVRANLAPDDSLFFVIGADAFAEIRSWRRWEAVVDAVEFIVVARPGCQYQIPEGAVVHELAELALPVSSSEIRCELSEGVAPEDLPPAVLAYIDQMGLYRAASA